jgi:flagellar biosynthetic protein FlhB
MSEQDGRTEPATPKKRSEERKKGNVCKTPELSSSLILLSGFILLNYSFKSILDNMKSFMLKTYTFLPIKSLTLEYINSIFKDSMLLFFKIVAPFLLMAAFIGFISNIAQVKLVFSFDYMQNAFSKFNIANGFKRMFSLNSVVHLFKDLLKFTVIILLAYNLMKTNLLKIILFTGMEPLYVVNQVSGFAYQFGLRVAIVILIIAIIDYVYQKKQFEDRMKMTKQEVKDEFKSQEGDPQIKSRIKSKQYGMRKMRMMKSIPDADVVITNPTMVAVAIKYTSEFDAPIVTAKGLRLIAKKIKEIALENGVPIIENVNVARSLYWNVEIGEQIPNYLFQTVAEILAYIYKLRNKYKDFAQI